MSEEEDRELLKLIKELIEFDKQIMKEIQNLKAQLASKRREQEGVVDKYIS